MNYLKKFLCIWLFSILTVVCVSCTSPNQQQNSPPTPPNQEGFVITFDSNGGSPVENIVVFGNDIEQPSAPTREGYHFDGWFLDGTKFDFSSVDSDVTLKAEWSPKEYELRFDVSESEVVVVYGEKVGALPLPKAQLGYEFVGWKIGEDLITAETVWEYTVNKTAEAVFASLAQFSVEQVEGIVNLHTPIQDFFIEAGIETVSLFADGLKEKSVSNYLTLSWERVNDATSYTVYLDECENFENPWIYEVESETVEIYNLKINTEYFWCVEANCEDGLKVSEISSFETASTKIRNIYVDGVTNVRDVGGFSAGEKQVKQGLIYRSGRLNQSYTKTVTPEVTEVGLKVLNNYLKIKSEIDFRLTDNSEVGGLTDTSVIGENVNYYLQSMTYGGGMLTNNKEALKNTFRIFADINNYPIIFHCNIGTDRTGAVSFLLNGLLGVSEEDLCLDYMFSNFGRIEGNRTVGTIKEYISFLKGYQGSTLSQQIEAYLISIGVTKNEIASIKNIMLEESDIKQSGVTYQVVVFEQNKGLDAYTEKETFTLNGYVGQEIDVSSVAPFFRGARFSHNAEKGIYQGVLNASENDEFSLYFDWVQLEKGELNSLSNAKKASDENLKAYDWSGKTVYDYYTDSAVGGVTPKGDGFLWVRPGNNYARFGIKSLLTAEELSALIDEGYTQVVVPVYTTKDFTFYDGDTSWKKQIVKIYAGEWNYVQIPIQECLSRIQSDGTIFYWAAGLAAYSEENTYEFYIDGIFAYKKFSAVGELEDGELNSLSNNNKASKKYLKTYDWSGTTVYDYYTAGAVGGLSPKGEGFLRVQPGNNFARFGICSLLTADEFEALIEQGYTRVIIPVYTTKEFAFYKAEPSWKEKIQTVYAGQWNYIQLSAQQVLEQIRSNGTIFYWGAGLASYSESDPYEFYIDGIFAYKTQSVVFASNGGSQVPNGEFVKGFCVDEPIAPKKTGFGFDGWFLDEQCTQKFDFSTPLTESLTLYAKWIEMVVGEFRLRDYNGTGIGLDENDPSGTASKIKVSFGSETPRIITFDCIKTLEELKELQESGIDTISIKLRIFGHKHYWYYKTTTITDVNANEVIYTGRYSTVEDGVHIYDVELSLNLADIIANIEANLPALSLSISTDDNTNQPSWMDVYVQSITLK